MPRESGAVETGPAERALPGPAEACYSDSEKTLCRVPKTAECETARTPHDYEMPQKAMHLGLPSLGNS